MQTVLVLHSGRIIVRPTVLKDLLRSPEWGTFALVGTSYPLTSEGIGDVEGINEFAQSTKQALEYVFRIERNTRAAREWYFTYPLPEFGNVTAASLVFQKRLDALVHYLDLISTGSYA